VKAKKGQPGQGFSLSGTHFRQQYGIIGLRVHVKTYFFRRVEKEMKSSSKEK
jgi:hypothetical protein